MYGGRKSSNITPHRHAELTLVVGGFEQLPEDCAHHLVHALLQNSIAIAGKWYVSSEYCYFFFFLFQLKVLLHLEGVWLQILTRLERAWSPHDTLNRT